MSNSIQSKFIETDRLRTHYLYREGSKETIVFLHGNGASSAFFKSWMRCIPEYYTLIAPDFRGFGKSEAKPIDARAGLKDLAEDFIILLDALKLDHVHIVGHSMGGNLGYYLIAFYSHRLLSSTFLAPGSPFGFGATTDATGTPTNTDYSGSGAGLANVEFVKRLQKKDLSEEDPLASPRQVMNQLYWKSLHPSVDNTLLLEGLLEMQIGDSFYPGDFVPSPYFPYRAPGNFGPINALSPKYNQNVSQLCVQNPTKCPVLWIYGDQDAIVSNRSRIDLGTLGIEGFVPNYPGEKVFPPQPMLDQIDHFFELYELNGGHVEKKRLSNVGHSPHLEKPLETAHYLLTFLEKEYEPHQN